MMNEGDVKHSQHLNQFGIQDWYKDEASDQIYYIVDLS
jgi:hypothetical protein